MDIYINKTQLTSLIFLIYAVSLLIAYVMLINYQCEIIVFGVD